MDPFGELLETLVTASCGPHSVLACNQANRNRRRFLASTSERKGSGYTSRALRGLLILCLFPLRS